jgi:antitoxin HicB
LKTALLKGITFPMLEMAHDVLGLMLTDYEDKGEIPTPSLAKDIELSEGASLVLIEVNTDDFRES